MSAHLPQELIDCFVDEFSKSVEDLKTLSLVGKRWLGRTRSHLFRRITLAPQDLKEIREYQEYLIRISSSHNSRRYYQPLSQDQKRLLHSSTERTLQALFLQSIADVIPFIRELRLESSIRLGGGRKIVPSEYFQRWMGFGDDDVVEQSILMRELGPHEDFYECQQIRWAESVDLPWGHQRLHDLPFRNLRYLHIQWGVFSWIMPPDYFPDPIHWPEYQFENLLKANGGTLEHVSVDEYPGYRPEQYTEEESSDTLLQLVVHNAPNLRSLCLGGLGFAAKKSPFSNQVAERPERSPPVYPSGENVPSAYSNPGNYNLPTRLSIERFSLRGFGLESTVLIEDSILNSRLVRNGKIKYLALSVMPNNYRYDSLLSSLCHSLTHLTLDMDESLLHYKLRLSSFLQLRYLQLVNDPSYPGCPRQLLHSIYVDAAEEHRKSSRSTSESLAALQKNVHLAFAFGPGIANRVSEEGSETALKALEVFKPWPGVDRWLRKMTTEFKSSCSSRLEKVTFDLSESILQVAFPETLRSGCLEYEEMDDWWCRPV